MHEDEENIFLNDKDVDEILNYAVHLGCMLTLMQNAPESINAVEETVEAYRELVQWLYESMPEALVPLSYSMANVYLQKYSQIEDAVSKFREELDEGL